MGMLFSLNKIETTAISECQFCGYDFKENEYVYFRSLDQIFLCKKCEGLFSQRGKSKKVRYRSCKREENQEAYGTRI
ncbi:hypothetical protein Sgly_2024 [Syntrophobotulus glycolicus DSM 8271]|uniref:Uncharacterized protein n=1 Tax=Syntrophobotulus glycolicus (strain DSM 8271 / FlGlyR) TaxID=645991 RepID=F0T1H6_SYNGF|nr:hypothetical protein Sgly_2024 [Syntrophobotulus glycolicus DSM 8271]